MALLTTWKSNISAWVGISTCVPLNSCLLRYIIVSVTKPLVWLSLDLLASGYWCSLVICSNRCVNMTSCVGNIDLCDRGNVVCGLTFNIKSGSSKCYCV